MANAIGDADSGGDDDSAGGKRKQRGDQRGGMSQSTETKKAQESAQKAEAQERTNELIKKIAEQLEKQIMDGAIELESLGQQIIIRIRENGSFPSGSANLQPQFQPIIREIATLLNDVPGEITVSGHTDNQQINSELYTNNWDLSAKRAVEVATVMTTVNNFDKTRVVVIGRADTKPLVPNDTRVNRTRNRRVEISIMQGKAKESAPISLSEEDGAS